MNLSLDVTVFGFSQGQFLTIELKHQKERKQKNCRRRVYSESHDFRKPSMRNTLTPLQKTVHKHTNAFSEQIR